MTTISTHILDVSEGSPAIGMTIRLQQVVSDKAIEIATDVTNQQGRIDSFSKIELKQGYYQLIAETCTWFRQHGRDSVFSVAQIDVYLDGKSEHLHLPFLISPGGWSTYKGTRG